MIRRFGYEEVRKAAGEESGEGVKVLGNIKKRKDRAKRKRAAAEEAGVESDEEGPGQGKAKVGDAFEDVLYGSESEIEDSDEEEGAGAAKGRKGQAQVKGKREFGARLRGDDEQPMDLLSGAATRVTSTFPSLSQPYPYLIIYRYRRATKTAQTRPRRLALHNLHRRPHGNRRLRLFRRSSTRRRRSRRSLPRTDDLHRRFHA